MRNPLYWGASILLLVAAACSSDGGIFGVANREPGSSLDASLGGPSPGSGGVRSGAGGARGDGGASGARGGGAGGSDCVGEACPGVGAFSGCCTNTGQCGVLFGTNCVPIPSGFGGMGGAAGSSGGRGGRGGVGGTSGAAGRATGGRGGSAGARSVDAGVVDGGSVVDAGTPCRRDSDCDGGICCATSEIGSVSALSCASSCDAPKAPIHCSEPADCTNNTVCCGDVQGGVYQDLSCVAQCPARTNGNGGYVLCKSNTDCANGETCQASQALPAGFTVCK